MEQKEGGRLAKIMEKWGVFHRTPQSTVLTPPVTPKSKDVDKSSQLSKTETKTPDSLSCSNPMHNTPLSTASQLLEDSGINKEKQFRKLRSSSVPLISSSKTGIARLEGNSNESTTLPYFDPTQSETDSDDGYDSETAESNKMVQIHLMKS